MVSLVWLGREFERGTEELRRRGSERFVKCFTIDFLVKYFTSFYAQTLVKLKIFYNFDYILHVNKHLKIRKYFMENILLRNTLNPKVGIKNETVKFRSELKIRDINKFY